MAKKDGYYSRKWLNKKKGHAFIEVESYGDDAKGCNVTIGDCSRHITLDFCIYEQHSSGSDCTKTGRLYKMDLLISELQKARALIAGISDDA